MQIHKKALTNYAHGYIMILKVMHLHRKEVINMYLNLKKEMERNGISIEDISKSLNLHRNTVSNKLNGTTPLSIEEGIQIRNTFFDYADFQYLFKKTA